MSRLKTRALGLIVGSCLTLSLGCRGDQPQPQTKQAPPPKPELDGADGGETGASSETGDPFSGEAAHVIPFADRTSMGYLLLLPPGTKDPEAPTRAQLVELVEQAFPGQAANEEVALLVQLIQTSPHATDLAAVGEIAVPTLDEPQAGESGSEGGAGPELPPVPSDPAELEALGAELEQRRIFDLIGLHIELIRLGIGDDATIPSSALSDAVLTRELDEQQRRSLLGREWALLLRADYRNQHSVRGLRLHQTLVRVAAEHYDAMIHDPDTLETVDVEAFTRRRLRAAAGNVADQVAIVPFADPEQDGGFRLSTRGMRRFGSVDVELDGLPRDGVVLQQASDLIAGLALLLAREAEVDVSGFAVTVPNELEVDCALVHRSYYARDYAPACTGSIALHLVERAPEPHDPRDHVVARIVAPRDQSDLDNYDHPHWVQTSLEQMFGAAASASGSAPTAN